MEKPLSQYLDSINTLIISKRIVKDVPIALVANHSAIVKKSSIFVAIPGSNHDGHDYIKNAVRAGAAAIVHNKELPEYHPDINYIKVEDSYLAYACLVEFMFAFPSEKLKLIGVTGTNGKTSSVYLLSSILNQNNFICGKITTVSQTYPGNSIPASRTTPEAYDIQRLFLEMRKNGCTHVIMEVSSHALAQERIGNTKLCGALFTNLTGDHLDYHKNMESYFQAKKLLFEKHLTADAVISINYDDQYGMRLFSELSGKNRITYGKNRNCDCIIKHARILRNGTTLELELFGKKIKIQSPLIGNYNVYNIAGVVSIAYTLGIPLNIICSALEKPVNIPGRLEAFETNNGIMIFVDYAHTDDALENVLKTLRDLTDKKLFVLFGCGGNRDKSKRPRMGAAAAKFADKIILTNDNPRNEDPVTILKEIASGIPSDSDLKTIPDRHEAIKEAISNAEPGDIVLLAGKGHEKYQEIKDKFFPFDDKQEVVSICKELNLI